MKPEDYSGAGGISSDLELYDSEVVEIARVAQGLSINIGRRRNLEGLRQEIINRFGEIGFEVIVDFYEAAPEDNPTATFIHPAITIKSRIEVEEEFDHARQGREVRANVLNTKGAPVVEERTTKVSMAGTQDSKFARAKSGLFVPK